MSSRTPNESARLGQRKQIRRIPALDTNSRLRPVSTEALCTPSADRLPGNRVAQSGGPAVIETDVPNLHTTFSSR
jgi:hypothetical protein